jgi:hypothetical protein
VAVRTTDIIGLSLVFAISLVAVGQLFAGGTLIGQDAATQFYPWYSYLGEQLRSFEIPGWNPHQFSGAPFAADPQSGWTYIPAMVLFTVLPLGLAVPAFLGLHLMLAGIGTYLLARLLGMPMSGAVVASAAYQLTGPVYGRSACCPAAVEVSVWAPWALVGAELAIRSGSGRTRLIGWTVAGFALSQSLAAWLGQGSYYLILALGAFVAYRTLLAGSKRRPIARRAATGAMHCAAIALAGFGLAAAGVVPRLAYIARSTLSDGEYDGPEAWAAQISGVSAGSVFDRLLIPTLHYPGAAVLALALIGLLVSGRRFSAPYFAILGIASAILASPETTPLHRALYTVLPRFEELHRHWPERISLVSYIAPAMLAGAAVSCLSQRPQRDLLRLAAVASPLAIGAMLWIGGAGIPVLAFLVVGAAAALLIALVSTSSQAVRRAVPLLSVLVIAVDLIAANRSIADEAPYGGFHRVDLDDYYTATGATEFLKDQSGEEPYRMFGYDPSLRSIQDGQTVLYRRDFPNAETRALHVNNRSTLWGLWDVQGYNPIQPRRYSELMSVLNGHTQDYHDANIFAGGVDSPLLDLLNVRYVIIPADADPALPDFQWLMEQFPAVYEDAEVQILENQRALPRVWVVHGARAATDAEALQLLENESVDPRRTALVAEELPSLQGAVTGTSESVSVIDHHADRIEVLASVGSTGMVVFSEMFDPGWRALLDGVSVPLHRVDHALTGVVVPRGLHRIELRYQTPGLLLGATITLITIAAIICAYLWLGFDRAGRRRVGSKQYSRPHHAI